VLPSCPWPQGLGYRVFTPSGPRSSSLKPNRGSSHGLALSFRVHQASSGRGAPVPPKGTAEPTAPPMRSFSPSASPHPGQRHDGRAYLTRPPAPSGFHNLLALSSAPSLVALFHATSAHGVAPFRALLLPCSRTPSPAPFPSCCLDDPDNRSTRPETDRRSDRKQNRHTDRPRERPQLQGFAPHESPPPAAGG
jgi:hypothetical protein